jgi:dynein heavy chain
MSLVFETQDLEVASPATVSRAGMIYIDASELPWTCYAYSWLNTKFPGDEESKAFHNEMMQKWIPRVLKFKEINCSEPVKISDFNAVMSLCALYDSICKNDPQFSKDALGDSYKSVAEKIFLFALTWTLGGAINETDRKNLSNCLLEIDPFVPSMHTVYDYYVDPLKDEFIGWDTKVPSFRYTKNMTFHEMIVPTVDTLRNSYIVDMFVKQKKNVMLVGGTGTGKTILAMSILKDLPDTHSQLVVNFSAATNSLSVQDIIEGPMEKRYKDKLGPIGGKTLVSTVIPTTCCLLTFTT